MPRAHLYLDHRFKGVELEYVVRSDVETLVKYHGITLNDSLQHVPSLGLSMLLHYYWS
jgi:hypothetical protein